MSFQFRCKQMRIPRGDTNTFFDLESSFISRLIFFGENEQPPAIHRRRLSYLRSNRSISRVLSDYVNSPDDHFSTSMVTHAL